MNLRVNFSIRWSITALAVGYVWVSAKIVHADPSPTTGAPSTTADTLNRDILGLHKVPQVFLADSPYPILETSTIPFSSAAQAKPKGSTITFKLPGGSALSGTVIQTFRDARRSSMGAKLKAPDGSPVTLHFDYNADGTFNSGVLLAKGENLSYSISRTSKGNFLIEAQPRESIIPIEPSLAPPAGAARTQSVATMQGTQPLAQLESLPGAPNVLLLDFDGHRTEGTSMNTESGYAVIISQASGLSVAEQSYLWSRVSEFFRPFNINVTTKESVFQSAPGTQRTRVVLSYTDWYNPRFRSTASGYAHVRSWGKNDGMTPVFVFLHYAGDDYVQSIVITHESGHALGLNHDGRTIPRQEYFAGHGNWGPLLGNPYEVPVAQWSKGEYAYASNGEDDLGRILSNPGISYRPDTVGDTRFTALTLTAPRQVGSVQYEGIITTRQDKDVFRFTTGKTKLSIQVLSFLPGMLHRGMLNVGAKLFDERGTMIASASPQSELPGASNLDAIFTPVSVPGGTYFLEVDGEGDREPLTTGYSDYSSIGSYTVRISGLVLHVATPTPSAIPTRTPTSTPTRSPTRTPTRTPTITRTPTRTPTQAASPSPQPTATTAATRTPQPTTKPTMTPSSTPTRTPTPTTKPPAQPTPTPTRTATPQRQDPPGPVPSRTFSPL